MRQQDIQVLSLNIKAKALEMAREQNKFKFKASKEWLDGFKKRNSIIYRKINSSTSKILEKEAELFHDYLDRLIDLIIDFTPDQILNFDEIRFDWDKNINIHLILKGKIVF